MSKKKWVSQADDVMTINSSIQDDNTRSVANVLNYNAKVLKNALDRIAELEKIIKLEIESEAE